MELGLISKLLLLLVVTLPDGSHETKLSEVTECPSYEVVQQIMNHRLKLKEITSWYAGCSSYPFLKLKKQPV